jgi:hypothetical protein
MKQAADHVPMITVFVLLIVVAIGPLAVFYGADSRLDEPRR